MAHHEGGDSPPRRPGKSMDVAPADPTGGHTDPNLPGARIGGIDLGVSEFPRGGEEQRFHGGSRLEGRAAEGLDHGKKGGIMKQAIMRSTAAGVRPASTANRFSTVSPV